jgi:hypothetical protein
MEILEILIQLFGGSTSLGDFLAMVTFIGAIALGIYFVI